MADTIPTTALQLRSLIRSSGELELSLVEVPIPEPGSEEVLVRIEASPINPSDLRQLLGAADMKTGAASGSSGHPIVTATVPIELMKAMAWRVDESMPVGNEGAGVVVKAGSSEAARALLGRVVALQGGAMHAQYRMAKADSCLVLEAGTTPAEGASCFVNPLTALGMIETMRREGHKALVHTAAASNLGQMLNRICIKDGIGLVNIVRRPEQEKLLHAIGAAYVCNSSSPTFVEDLTSSLIATGATIAFDAVGGGKMGGQILGAMETAANATAKEFSRYGSTVHKQVYIYGLLNLDPIELARDLGMAWGVGGWLLPAFLQKIGPDAALKLRERVASEIKTSFTSTYTKEVSLAQALHLDEIAIYSKVATGTKYLINPNKPA